MRSFNAYTIAEHGDWVLMKADVCEGGDEYRKVDKRSLRPMGKCCTSDWTVEPKTYEDRYDLTNAARARCTGGVAREVGVELLSPHVDPQLLNGFSWK